MCLHNEFSFSHPALHRFTIGFSIGITRIESNGNEEKWEGKKTCWRAKDERIFACFRENFVPLLFVDESSSGRGAPLSLFTFYGSVKTTVFPPPRLTPSRSREKESFCEIYPRRYEPAPPLDQVTRPSDGHALSSLKRISVISSSTNFFGFRKILERYTADNNRYAVQLRHLLFKWSFAHWTLPVF